MTELEKKEIIKKCETIFKLLDCYLIGDLETMINEVGQKDCGGLGYPAIHSVIAGIELLGLLVSGKKQEKAFKFFWENYFKKENSCYEGANTMIYRAVRQGTAHIFLVKAGISVTKSGADHFKLHESDGKTYLNIDAKCFFKDFKSCYEKVKNSILIDQDEKMLTLFDNGYQQLFKQIKSGRTEIEKFIKSKTTASESSVTPCISSIGQTTTVSELPNPKEQK